MTLFHIVLNRAPAVAASEYYDPDSIAVIFFREGALQLGQCPTDQVCGVGLTAKAVMEQIHEGPQQLESCLVIQTIGCDQARVCVEKKGTRLEFSKLFGKGRI